MQKQFFHLSPVEVVKVTSSNLEEVAEWCGGKVAETESRRHPGRMDKYVWVPTPKDSKISWAFPGMFITRRVVVTMKDEIKATWAVYRRDYFEKNYFDTPIEALEATWGRESEERKHPKKRTVEVTVNIGDALRSAETAKANIKEIGQAAGLEIADNVVDAILSSTPVIEVPRKKKATRRKEALEVGKELSLEDNDEAISG